MKVCCEVSVNLHGTRAEVLVREAVPAPEVDEEGEIGRSMADAPEIDGAVYLHGETNIIFK